MIRENPLVGLKNRILQYLCRFAPGATTTRVWLHRLRGVQIGANTFIGTDVLIDTAWPERVSIGSNVIIGLRSALIAHFDLQPHQELRRGALRSIVVEDDVFIGPGVIILPNVKIGCGAVVAAGAVVTHSVPANTMVQGNPAIPVAHCGIPLRRDTEIWKFYAKLKKIKKSK